MFWIILLVIIFLLFVILKKTKRIKLNCVTMINGGVKTGKSSLAVHLSRKQLKKNRFKYYFKKYLCGKWDLEKPYLYSNIPLTCEYIPLTNELITRLERFAYGSVVYLGESSLVADSQSYKNDLLNEQMMLFIKLFGHETKGGHMFIDTQSVEDNHYAVKRCLNNYLYIHHLTKWIPFILVFKVREMVYSSDNQSAVNVFNEDVEETMKYFICTKRVWKMFDCYCYSCFTDNLPVNLNVQNKDKKRDLKARNIVTFKTYQTLKNGGVLNEKEN